MLNPRNKLILTGLAIVIVLGGLFTFIASGANIAGNRNSQIETMVVPTQGTTITVNGKQVDEGLVDLEPGKYEVVFSHDGFEGQSRTVVLQENQTTKVSVILFGNTPETIDWYSTHDDDARKAEGISGSQASATFESAASKLPLLEELPHESVGRYAIGFGKSAVSPDDASIKAIYINYRTEADKTAAQNWIRYRGYDPDKLEIIYSTSLSGSR